MWNLLYQIEDYFRYLYTKFRGFLPEDAMVRDFLDNLSEKDEELIRTTRYQDLIRLHMTMGRDIRNRYGLWYESNPYTNYELPDSSNHPDEVSFRVLQKVWDVINSDY